MTVCMHTQLLSIRPADYGHVIQMSNIMYDCVVQVVCGGGERKTISDDEDIYSDQQKLPRRIASKVQVSWLSIYYVYTSTSILPYGYGAH